MAIALTGSIATDHLMHFPGLFSDNIQADQLESISLSFLVDDLDIRRGGVAADIAFGIAALNGTPVLVGAVGTDFADYRKWLDDHGVDTKSVHTSETRHTARFTCTTDDAQNQIGSFYPGAMVEAPEIALAPVAERVGGFDVVVISPNDPAAMLVHARECRERGYRFAADPSQQLAALDGEQVRDLVDGATYLFTNDYESTLLLEKSGWSEQDVLDRVGYWVSTHGADGVNIRSTDGTALTVPAVSVTNEADPTGAGDAFRAGFLWGVDQGLSFERASQVGCSLASCVLETVGPQEYELDHAEFRARIKGAYGDEAAAEIGRKLKV